ncbi:gamma carbonic anhydrase family protein [bacterium]|nr:gamma carbonic anhydrase family protein [bacterium]
MEQDTIRLGRDVGFGQNVVKTGNINIGDQTSIWHNVILRGDVAPIMIGARCNIQDNTVVHGQLNRWSTKIGDGVSVGHSCILHGCELSDESFIGMGSILMNGSFIGNRVMVAAGSLISQGSRFEEPNTLVMGRPGKVVRELREEEINMILNTPKGYIEYARQWLSFNN